MSEKSVKIKKIAVLTSGGDCGGLNAVIKGVAYTARSVGIETLLIPNGYAGLYNLVDIDRLTLLDTPRLEKFFLYMAGSEAGNSRVKISKIEAEDKYDRIRSGLHKFGIDALVIAGGDDTGSVAVDLAGRGIPCVHAPKTMDLDLMPYSVGGDSTINRIATFAQELRTTGATHNRIVVLEVFGRYAGHTALRGGVAAEADVILIPEVGVDFDLIYRHLKERLTRRISTSDVYAGLALVVVAEGLRDASGGEIVDKKAAPDAFGHRPLVGAGKYVMGELQSRLKTDPEIEQYMRATGQYVKGIYEIPEVREIRPSHLVRCGFTTAMDVSFGLEVGAGAVELVRQGIFGVTIVSYREGRVEYMESAAAIQQRYVDMKDVSLYEGMGICFGRHPLQTEPRFEKLEGRPTRPY